MYGKTMSGSGRLKFRFAGQTKRFVAALLSMAFLFTAVACDVGIGTVQSDESTTDTSAAVTTVPSETTSDTTTETTEPEPAGLTGSYQMMYDREHTEFDPIGVRMELLTQDDKLAVLFVFLFENEADFTNTSYGPYIIKTDVSTMPVTAEYEDDKLRFKLESDGKTADVSYKDLLFEEDPGPLTLTGHYERLGDEDYSSINAFPEAENDPASPAGSVDKVLARLARENLGLSESTVLPEEDLSKIYELNIDDEYSLSLNGIEYFTNLKTIRIQCSNIRDISPLANVRSLEEVYIYRAFVDNIPDLSACSGLTSLALIQCNIRDITPVAVIGSLKKLQLGGNMITSIAPIKDLKNLESLSIGSNPITDWETISGNDKLIAVLDQDYAATLKVLKKAKSVVDEAVTSDMSELEKEMAIYKKVHEIAVQGFPEESSDVFAYNVLIKGKGICVDFAEAVSLLMTLAGLECFMVGSSTHEWDVIKIDGSYYEIDCMWDADAPADWQYFNISRARMDLFEQHHIDIMNCPLATQSMMRLQYLLME